MKITNVHNLPTPLIKAVESHKHKSGFISASKTSDSPRMYWLTKRHWNELEEDVSSRIWALFGTAAHVILEQAGETSDITEDYFEQEVAGEIVSGIVDLYKNQTISDWKTTSVWKVIYKDRDGLEEWENQFNTLAFLLRKAGHTVNKLEGVCILRDWQASKAKIDPSYPQVQIVSVPIKLWDIDKQQQFLEGKVKLFKSHENTPDIELPDCTDKERWFSGNQWAVKKKGGKRALRVFNNKIEAQEFAREQEIKKVITETELRKGVSKRCDYCSCQIFCGYKD